MTCLAPTFFLHDGSAISCLNAIVNGVTADFHGTFSKKLMQMDAEFITIEYNIWHFFTKLYPSKMSFLSRKTNDIKCYSLCNCVVFSNDDPHQIENK